MKKRSLKSTRDKTARASHADPQLYHGQRARFHHFQCLQLILRHQIKAVVELWKLPSEFETICRDIWALHLSLIPSVLIAEPLLFRQDPTTSGHNNKVNSNSSQSDESEDEVDLDVLSESSSCETSESRSEVPQFEDGSHRRHRTHEMLANNIAVLALACWTLRIPILYMDFIRAIENYDLPYLNALSLIPPEMTRHLTRHRVQALSPYFSPATTALHAIASRLGKRLYSTYSVFTPEVNAAPVLWRAVRCLCGNANLYSLAKILAGLLSLPLTLNNILSPARKMPKRHDPETHKFDNISPEVALIAVVIVVLRLVYGLDGRERFPRLPNDPAWAFPSFREYLAQLRASAEIESQEPHQVFSTDNYMPVGELSDVMLDQYLDFCAEKALSSRPGNDSIVEEYFPIISKVGQGPTRDMSPPHPVTRLSTPMPTSRNENSLSPAEGYRIYNSRDVFGLVPEEYKLVVERAARWTGVREQHIYSVVEKFERRFSRWWKDKKRLERENDTAEECE